MTLADLDHELDELRAALQHIGANLVAIEQDPTVALLDLADLGGASAQRWHAARVAAGRPVRLVLRPRLGRRTGRRPARHPPVVGGRPDAAS